MHDFDLHSVISNGARATMHLSTVLYLREPTYVNQVIAWLCLMPNDVKSREAIVQ